MVENKAVTLDRHLLNYSIIFVSEFKMIIFAILRGGFSTVISI